MTGAQQFMRVAGGLSDPELAVMMRSSMMTQLGDERLHWLRQIELALDGYGGERHFASAERIAGVLRLLETELQGDASLTVA